MRKKSINSEREIYVLVAESRYQKLKRTEERYKVLKALLLLFGENPKQAVDLMQRTVWCEERKEEMQ